MDEVKISPTERRERCSNNTEPNEAVKIWVNELDKFKRRLIRAIARLMYKDNKPETEIWEELKKETRCDCELLWSRMRALTIKKLVRLFTAEDKLENITKIAQLSVTDWLMYDLVLVNEKVDVIGQDLSNEEEPAFLRDLFELVVEYDLENASGDDLTKNWFDATAKYNNKGKRQCSPMLLQKRWHQLKELSRSNFYKFWFEYRGDPKNLEKAKLLKPSDLQMDIVKRYKTIVTNPFLNWEDLVKEKKVAIPEDFERLRLSRSKVAISENEPDLEVVEPHVETIDLEETIDDSNDSTNDDAELGFCHIDIVKVESLSEQLDDVSVLENVHIPLENSRTNDSTTNDVIIDDCNDVYDMDPDVVEDEHFMPKITSVTSQAYLGPSKDADEVDEADEDQVVIEKEDERQTSTADVNIILEEIVKNVMEKKINIEATKESEENVKLTNKDVANIKTNIIIDLDNDENTTQAENDFKAASDEKKDVNDMGFGVLPGNMSFIQFEDDGIEFVDEDYEEPGSDEPDGIAIEEETFRIDRKLLLTPLVLTKKLDAMDVFRFKDYSAVKDMRVLEIAERESKPLCEKPMNTGDASRDSESQINESNERIVTKDVSDKEHDKITASSWLFRKPKVNSYNPIQLCKNPDFNTRLKRLTLAFYASQRNRQQLKQCKPLTVDLHKAFESKLIDNTLYLNNANKYSDMEIFNEIAVCKTESPEIIENDVEIQLTENRMPSEAIPDGHIERSKVIHLPDIDQIRRVNQRLLVAEVSPIQVSNTLYQTDVEPPISSQKSIQEPDPAHSCDKDVSLIESSQDPSAFSHQADEDQVPTEDDSVKLPENKYDDYLDIEPNEILHSSAVDNAAGNVGKAKMSYNKKPKPFKIRSKPISKKPLALSWYPKATAINSNSTDCLLAADTVERILSLCKDDYVPEFRKPMKKKRKRKIIVQINDKPNETQAENEKEVATTSADSQKSVPEKRKCKEKSVKETEKPKRRRCKASTQTTNAKNVCCWARHKIDNFMKINIGKHFCGHNRCSCCCAYELQKKLEEEKRKYEAITLSDEEPPVKTKVSVGINTDYDKEFEDQYANNLNIFNDNPIYTPMPIVSLPFGNMPQCISNENGCQTVRPNPIELPSPRKVPDDRITEDSLKQKKKKNYQYVLVKIKYCSVHSNRPAKRARKMKIPIKTTKLTQFCLWVAIWYLCPTRNSRCPSIPV